VCGLLFAVLRFRAFFEPLGLAEAAVLDERHCGSSSRAGEGRLSSCSAYFARPSTSSSGRPSPTVGPRPLPRLRHGRARGPRRRIRGHRPGRARVPSGQVPRPWREALA
jgi:hypothetical protein